MLAGSAEDEHSITESSLDFLNLFSLFNAFPKKIGLQRVLKAKTNNKISRDRGKYIREGGSVHRTYGAEERGRHTERGREAGIRWQDKQWIADR